MKSPGNVAKKKPSKVIVIDFGRVLFKSRAWVALTRRSTQVYMLFLIKRRIVSRLFPPKAKARKACSQPDELLTGCWQNALLLGLRTFLEKSDENSGVFQTFPPRWIKPTRRALVLPSPRFISKRASCNSETDLKADGAWGGD
jgi:hypothetical protein